jgi:hypothetical protein
MNEQNDLQKKVDEIKDATTTNTVNITWLRRIVWVIVAGAFAKIMDYFSQ